MIYMNNFDSNVIHTFTVSIEMMFHVYKNIFQYLLKLGLKETKTYVR